MITGNEPAYSRPHSIDSAGGVTLRYDEQDGMTIFQYLSAKFAASLIIENNPNLMPGGGTTIPNAVKLGCVAAEALIAEWNKRKKEQQ